MSQSSRLAAFAASFRATSRRAALVLSCLVGGVSLMASPAASAVVIAPTAVSTIQLSASGVEPNTASIAYDPTYGFYYGSRAGSVNYTAVVWNTSGVVQQSLQPMGADARGWIYNPNTGNLELVTYLSDLLTVGRDGAGLLTGSYTTVLTDMSGAPSDQSMASYNPAQNVLYAMVDGPNVSVLDRATGNLTSTIVLDFGAAGISALNSYFIGFDPSENALVGAAGSTAYVFGLDGSYLGSSALGTSTEGAFNAGYANGQLFVYDQTFGGFQGYDIFAGTVPEPAMLLLVGAGLAGLGWSRSKAAR